MRRLFPVTLGTVAFCAALVAGAGDAAAKAYKGAEIYTQKSYQYGRVELRMRAAKGSGLLSTFFTYKNGSEVAGEIWEEIDIEVFGKDDAKSWQSNIISGAAPKASSEMTHALANSLADAYHTYVLEWTPQYVSWSLDGKEVRKTQGGQVDVLKNPESLRMNIWSSESAAWVGPFDDSVLPQAEFVEYIKYFRYEGGQFVLDWEDDFDTLDTTRWAFGDWTFDTNRVDFSPKNVLVKDGVLVLAITKEGQEGFQGTVPKDGSSGEGGSGGAGSGSGGTGGNPTAGASSSGSTGGNPTAGASSSGSAGGNASDGAGGNPSGGESGDCGCVAAGAPSRGPGAALVAAALVASYASRRRSRSTRPR
jgi:endo-1,3-1,4-beta-glycanase ExoK